MKLMLKNSDLLNLNGKVAIVTGAAKGIGLGIAKRLAEAGAHVLISDLDKDSCDKVVDELKAIDKI